MKPLSNGKKLEKCTKISPNPKYMTFKHPTLHTQSVPPTQSCSIDLYLLCIFAYLPCLLHANRPLAQRGRRAVYLYLPPPEILLHQPSYTRGPNNSSTQRLLQTSGVFTSGAIILVLAISPYRNLSHIWYKASNSGDILPYLPTLQVSDLSHFLTLATTR